MISINLMGGDGGSGSSGSKIASDWLWLESDQMGKGHTNV